jgi:IS30 family transposase
LVDIFHFPINFFVFSNLSGFCSARIFFYIREKVLNKCVRFSSQINRGSTSQKQGEGLLKVINTLKQIKVLSIAWWLVKMDLIGPMKEKTRGNRYHLTLVDYFTKWEEAVPIPAKDAVTVAKALYEHVYYRNRAFHRILIDNGGEFSNAVGQENIPVSAR